MLSWLSGGRWLRLGKPFTALAAIAALAWLLLAVGGGPLFEIPVLCTGRLLGTIPGSAELAYTLSWVSPAHLAASWTIMLVAMMVPAVAGPIAHVRIRSFCHKRNGSTWAFLLGYLGTWMAAGVPLIGFALFLRLLADEAAIPFLAAFSLAVMWQMTAWKQVALNRCHARPPLMAFGRTPLRAGFGFGGTHGLWCVASCGPIMLTALVAPTHNQLWMIVAASWIWAERLESPRIPAFRLSVPQRALRAGHFRISIFLNRLKSKQYPKVRVDVPRSSFIDR